MKPIDVVLLLLDQNQDTAKVIRKVWDSNIEDFWIGLDLALSNLDFNLEAKNVPSLDPEDEDPGSLTFGEFFNIAMRIASGNLEGQEAIDEIKDLALKANAIEWNLWYRRILLKSLPKYLPMESIKKELINLTSS